MTAARARERNRTATSAAALGGALALDLHAVRMGAYGATWGAVAVHAVASAIAAAATAALLPEAYRAPRALGLTFLFVVALFVPLLGAAGAFLTVVLPLHFPRAQVIASWSYVPEPELPLRAPKIDANAMVGEGALVATIRQNREPSLRLRAVMAARQMRDRDMIPIVRVALKDRVDDVRLLAYAMLDKKEQGLLAGIQQATTALASADEAHARARLHRRIAEGYWELAYLGLASGEVLAHVLESARTHVESARADDPRDPALPFLHGRVLLAQKRRDDARAAFTEARALGFSKNQVLPYLAEIAFLERRFADVRALLDDLDPLAGASSPLAAVVRYWTS